MISHYLVVIGVVTIKQFSIVEATVTVTEEERSRNHASCTGTRWARYFTSYFKFILAKAEKCRTQGKVWSTRYSVCRNTVVLSRYYW